MSTLAFSSAKEKSGIKVFGMSIQLFLLPLVAVLLVHFTDSLPKGLAGAVVFSMVFGTVFGEIGDRLPIFKEYIGGAPVLIFLAAAFFVHQGWFTEREIAVVTDFMKDSKFLTLYIIVLMTGSIFAVNRKLLLKSIVGYLPAIIVGVIGASIMGILGGFIFGITPKEIMMLYVLPTMGGGNGAGAVPLSEIYESATGNSKETYYSYAIAVLTIANIWAIVVAAVLNKIGKKYPELSGEGELVRAGNLELEEDEKMEVTPRDMAVGLLVGLTAYTLGTFLNKNVAMLSGIHTYALTVLLLVAFNGLGIIPLSIKQGAGKFQSFFSKQLTWVLMVGVGVAYTDLGEIMAAITPANVIIALMIVIGATVGAGVMGHIVGFYAIESSITAGLCMANRGGSGDIEVLGASKRMNLISYAQISSRLGGGIILIIASIVFKILAG